MRLWSVNISKNEALTCIFTYLCSKYCGLPSVMAFWVAYVMTYASGLCDCARQIYSANGYIIADINSECKDDYIVGLVKVL